METPGLHCSPLIRSVPCPGLFLLVPCLTSLMNPSDWKQDLRPLSTSGEQRLHLSINSLLSALSRFPSFNYFPENPLPAIYPPQTPIEPQRNQTSIRKLTKTNKHKNRRIDVNEKESWNETNVVWVGPVCCIRHQCQKMKSVNKKRTQSNNFRGACSTYSVWHPRRSVICFHWTQEYVKYVDVIWN